MTPVKSAKSQQLEIERLISALEKFRKLDAEIPVQTIIAFLRAVQKEGQRMTDLAKAVDVSQSSMSRNLSALSDQHWRRDSKGYKLPGFGLLEHTVDPMDSRRKEVTVTKAGHRFLAEVLSPWRS